MKRSRLCAWLTTGVAMAASGLSAAGVASTQVNTSDMQRYCQGEAASKFDQRPANILTLPMEHTSGGYTVYGQFPPDGNNVTTFQCRFNSDRTFRDVSKSGHSNGGSGNSSGGSSSYGNLVGTDREDAQKKLGKMGFKMQKPANDDRGSLWWNGATKECLELRGKKGRVKSIEATSTSRCH
jgi:hypothetical protein